MLTEPVICDSCSAISANGGVAHCDSCFKEAIRSGFIYALNQYGIWKNGEQTIGCMETNIKDVIKKFDESNTVNLIAQAIKH